MQVVQAVKAIVDGMPEQISALIVSGAAGAYVRAVFAPESHWRRRISEGIAGALGAIFLGGLVGYVIDNFTGAGVWSYCAAMGEGGIAAVRGVRRVILKQEIDK